MCIRDSPELDPSKAFSWSPELFAAYANVLEDLGREAESAKWRDRALLAESALSEHLGGHDQIEVIEVYEHAPREERSESDHTERRVEDRSERVDDAAPLDDSDAAAGAEEPDGVEAADDAETSGDTEAPDAPLEPAQGE